MAVHRKSAQAFCISISSWWGVRIDLQSVVSMERFRRPPSQAIPKGTSGAGPGKVLEPSRLLPSHDSHLLGAIVH
jgi:hypothetical protein